MSFSHFDTADIALVLWIFGVNFPFAIYVCSILKNEWNTIYIRKRRQRIVLFLFWAICHWEFAFISSTIALHFSNSIVIRLLYLICYVITLPLPFITGLIILLKFWTFYYSSQINIFNKHKAWRVGLLSIDPTKSDLHDNWFIKHSNYLQNDRYLFIVCCIIGLMWSIVGLIIFGNLPLIIYDLWLVLYGIICVIFGIFLIFKLKYNQKDDSLGIRKELIFLAWFIFIAGVLFFTVSWIANSIKISQNKNVDQEWTFWFRYAIVALFTPVYLYSIIMYKNRCQCKCNCKCVCDKYKISDKKSIDVNSEGNKNLENLGSNSPISNHKNDSKLSIDINVNSCDMGSRNMTWRNVVSTFDGFELLMDHLEAEFSQENLLFIVEVRYRMHEYFDRVL